MGKAEKSTLMALIPPGITVEPIQFPGGAMFAFSHKRLGPLGRLMVKEVAEGGMQISADVAPGEISDPQYLLRIELLNQVVQACLEALPGNQSPPTALHEIRQQVWLYQRFLAVRDTTAMRQLVERLSTDELTCLLTTIAETTHSLMQQRDLERLSDIEQQRTDLLQALPPLER